jgi:hypothetical protein
MRTRIPSHILHPTRATSIFEACFSDGRVSTVLHGPRDAISPSKSQGIYKSVDRARSTIRSLYTL